MALFKYFPGARSAASTVAAVAEGTYSGTWASRSGLAVHLKEKTWQDAVGGEFDKPYFKQLEQFLAGQDAQRDVKVVVLGQDPYHGPGQAHGLSFSVMPGVRPPPSLQNIYKELESDDGVEFVRPAHGYLQPWAEQGVLMLNSVLTVKLRSANSHKGMGWEQFTDAIISQVSAKLKGVVFLLWGKHAQAKSSLINKNRHTILKCSHPSPYSADRGFFGSKHFSKTNQALEAAGLAKITWQLPEKAMPAPTPLPAGTQRAREETASSKEDASPSKRQKTETPVTAPSAKPAAAAAAAPQAASSMEDYDAWDDDMLQAVVAEFEAAVPKEKGKEEGKETTKEEAKK